ncbi:MAG: AbrB/MazE/SpoVT family DNA-binding domain-containing protein [Candidatus Dormibacteraceae bacterium]
MKRVIQKSGNSLVVSIPAESARHLGFREGETVEVNEEGGGIMVRPTRSLAKIIAEWDDLAPGVSEADLFRRFQESRDSR